MKIDWKQVWTVSWPHLVAISVFLVLTMVYFAPEIFEGKVLPQGDMMSAQCMGADAAQYEAQTGERPHWSNAMFGGMPHNYSHPLMPDSVYYKIAQILRLGLPVDTAAPLWILLLGFYIFMLCAGCSPWLSIVGAIAFAFASYNIIILDAGHVTKAYVIATIPALIGGVMLTYRKQYIAGALVVLLATGMNVHWNHQQISYYALIMLVVLAVVYLVYAIREKEIKHYAMVSCMLLGLAILAISPGMGRLIPTYDYQKETMRGGSVLQKETDGVAEKSGLNRDYAFSWSYGKMETFTLLIPNCYGGGSNYPIGEDSETYKTIKKYANASSARQFANSAPTYWGDQPFTSGPVYAGAIICFLFILGLMVVNGKERWWLLAAAVIGIVMAWGRHFAVFNNLLFDYLPLYNKFRTPSMALVITTTSMAIMAMLALKEVLSRNVKARDLYIAAGVSGGLCLLFALIPSLMGNFQGSVDAQLPDWLRATIEEDRRAMLVASAWRSLGFIAIAFLLLLIYIKNERTKNMVVVGLMGVLVLVDLWSVDKKYLNDSHFVRKNQCQILPTDVDKTLMQDTDPDYRVLNLTTNTFNESKTSYFHKSIGGYSPAKLRRYQDIIDYYLSGRINMNVLDMLNTKYVITQEGVQRNPGAMGNAWFVSQIDWVNNPNEEIAAIGEANLRAVAVMDTCLRSKTTATTYQKDSTCKIALTSYAAPDHLYYESQCGGTGLVVFSEIYYKTWRAYIDGNEVPILRANYILRAVEVPEGNHTIEFRCVDELFVKCNHWVIVCSVIYSLAVVALIALLIYRKQRK